MIHTRWQLYFGHVVPRTDSLVTHHYHAYNYLQQSTRNFVSVTQLATMFKAAGLTQVGYQTFNLGAAVHFGIKSY